MEKHFETGDYVRVTQPLSADENRVVVIVTDLGPGRVLLHGQFYQFEKFFHVHVPKYGMFDIQTGLPIVYPLEFLEYALPEDKRVEEPLTWQHFDDIMKHHGITNLSNTIIQGNYKA